MDFGLFYIGTYIDGGSYLGEMGMFLSWDSQAGSTLRFGPVISLGDKVEIAQSQNATNANTLHTITKY